MHFEIPRSDQPAYGFEGELIVHVESDRDITELGWRGYDLSVYARKDDGFVCVIDFLSTCKNESRQTLVESVDSSQDVEDFFFAFEPNELLDPDLRRTLTEQDRQSLMQRLYARYDMRVASVLERVRAFSLAVAETS